MYEANFLMLFSQNISFVLDGGTSVSTPVEFEENSTLSTLYNSGTYNDIIHDGIYDNKCR